MFDGAVVLGIPELALLVVATGATVAFLSIKLNTSWKNNNRQPEIVEVVKEVEVEKIVEVEKEVVKVVKEVEGEQETFPLGTKRDYFGDILKTITHEVNAPIEIVIGTSSKMVEDAKNVAQVEHQGISAYLDRVRRDAEVINRRGKTTQLLISRAITLAKLQDPEFVELLQFNDLSIKDLVVGCIRVIEDKHGISITQHVASNLPRVNGNQGLLQRAVDNLLENAVKHSGNRKGIAVNLSRGEMQDHVTCQVTDKGVGIPAAQLKEIFLLGVQLDPSKEGMGFGLSEVKRTVEGLHKGRLDVDSTVGTGTTFTIHLPCAEQNL